MDRWREARQAWDRTVRITEGRALAAVIALLVLAGVRAFQLVVAAWQVVLIDGARAGSFSEPRLEASDDLAAAGAAGTTAMFVISGVLFLCWLSRTVSVARALSPTSIRWSASDAVWGFIIPFVCFVRPYQVVRDLHDQLDPDAVPEPAPRPRLDGAGYRDVPIEKAPPPRTLPHAFIGAWWALFIVERLLDRFGGTAGYSAAEIQSALWVAIGSYVVAIGGALLAVLVVRAVEGRLAERYRRLRHASDEELEAWGIAA